MLIHLLDTLSNAPIADLQHYLVSQQQHLLGMSHLDHIQMPDLLAYGAIKETDFVGDVGKAWGKFVRTGQVWAFLAGGVFGYLLKTFTTYG
jgi:hypothetical protein